MNRSALATLALATVAILFLPSTSAGQTVLWSQRFTVDTDGDGTVNLADNAPGTSNPFQEDLDADQIGDAIDPTPTTAIPNLGTLMLGMNGPATPLPAGSTAIFDYLMMTGVPPGGFGHIDLDFGGNGVYDATYFGPLTAGINQISITAALFVDALWNLNAAGTYTLHALAYGPGMSTPFETITNVTIVPEPAAVAMATLGVIGIAGMFRRSGRSR